MDHKERIILKTFKVEIEQVSLKRGHVSVTAEDRKQALDLDRRMKWEDLQETEKTEQIQRRVKRNWNFFDLFFGTS